MFYFFAFRNANFADFCFYYAPRCKIEKARSPAVLSSSLDDIRSLISHSSLQLSPQSKAVRYVVVCGRRGTPLVTRESERESEFVKESDFLNKIFITRPSAYTTGL